MTTEQQNLCNWFWGSHGCSLLDGHDGHHLCGTTKEPCSMHSGTMVKYHYVGGDWATEWTPMAGFCNGDGIPRLRPEWGNYPPCPHPDVCSSRKTKGHRGW